MQSRSVVRGSTRSAWSVPLIRSEIGTAPSMAGPCAPSATVVVVWLVVLDFPGAHAAVTAAAAVVPVMRRKVRRVGFFAGLENGSSGIAAPVGGGVISGVKRSADERHRR